MRALEIRTAASLEEWQQTLDLQSEIWGYGAEDQVPSRLLGVFERTGGCCQGAFLDGKMVGFSLAFAGFKASGQRYWHSHMVGVRPQLHSRGIGYRLKLAQRDAALAVGVERIEWTFDPLEARNAYFNVSKLGAEAERYLPDFYGTTSSPLHGGMPTDRLVAVWRLRSRRVTDRLRGVRPPPGCGAAQVEIPARPELLPQPDALRVQSRVRSKFQAAFARGLKATRFSRGADVAIYHLDR